MRHKSVPSIQIIRCLLISLIVSMLTLTGPGFARPDNSAALTQLHKMADAQSDIIYATVDDRAMKLDLYVPKNYTEDPVPLVVWVHGGAWLAGSKANPPAVPLLAEGFAVASISYRFSDVAVFPAQIHDCKAAIRFLRSFLQSNHEKYNVDPDRIGVWGASAGGHLVALLGTTSGSDTLDGTVGDHTDTSDDVQAVCDWFGPSDMFTMPISARRIELGEHPIMKLLGGTPADKPGLAKLCSPVHHVSKNDPPFLIMHGDQDNTVPLQQSRLLYEKLKAAGVDAELIVMEGKGHGFRGPEALNPVIEFFQRTLMKTQSGEKFETDTIRTSQGDLTITFIGHGTLMLQAGEKVIHIDPWTRLADYSELPRADVILITHEHGDHLDPEATERIRRDDTRIIATPACAEKVADCITMKNGDQRDIFEGLTVEAVPAYNIVHKRSNGQPYHPKGRGNGYVLTIGETRVYIAGDTENIPEMAGLENIDIAFLPMNVPYTMTPEMVADAARSFKPEILYPYHYGETDASKLADLLKDEKEIKVRIRRMQ